eukprot:5086870-Alexandrium_andersonii.AAC.1
MPPSFARHARHFLISSTPLNSYPLSTASAQPRASQRGREQGRQQASALRASRCPAKPGRPFGQRSQLTLLQHCLLYTSDAADDM